MDLERKLICVFLGHLILRWPLVIAKVLCCTKLVPKVTLGNVFTSPFAPVLQCRRPEAACTECQTTEKVRCGGAFLTMKPRAAALFANWFNLLASKF